MKIHKTVKMTVTNTKEKNMIYQTPIHEAHDNMLEVQEEIANKYKYKKLPPIISLMQRAEYEDNLPTAYKYYNTGTKIYTPKGTLICNTLTDRVYVCGDYGIYLEANKEDMILSNLVIKEGQEYRIYDPRFKDRVKYQWFTINDGSDIKIYYQQRGVDYADYKVGKYYFSPYETDIIRALGG